MPRMVPRLLVAWVIFVAVELLESFIVSFVMLMVKVAAKR